jgi:hypothetical protein
VSKKEDLPARPWFLITIDTEGDNVWSRPPRATTRNAEFLEPFQELCERHRLKPTWLANHEMIVSPVFRRFAGDVLARGTAEVGMHLHAWDSPPLIPLTSNDAAVQPYLVEYDDRVMQEKVHALTAMLEDQLGVKMLSHRAGRWSLDERYAEILLEEGYKVDSSVTPLVSWASQLGDPSRNGGADYTHFPKDPYWIDLDDVSCAGSSDLLEVPMTVVSSRPVAIRRIIDFTDRLPDSLEEVRGLSHRVADRLAPSATWLRPNRRNAGQLRRVAERALEQGRLHVEFMLHSSELMPGGSPTFPDEESIGVLYGGLESLFKWAHSRFRAVTLAEFREEFATASARDAERGTR